MGMGWLGGGYGGHWSNKIHMYVLVSDIISFTLINSLAGYLHALLLDFEAMSVCTKMVCHTVTGY
jgi:hypothetical protein